MCVYKRKESTDRQDSLGSYSVKPHRDRREAGERESDYTLQTGAAARAHKAFFVTLRPKCADFTSLIAA